MQFALLTALLAADTERALVPDASATNAALGDALLSLSPLEFRARTYQETGYDMSNWSAEMSSASLTEFDFKNYLLHLWHPGAPRGASCPRLERFGNDGDGGKMVCNAEEVISRHAEDCLIVSVGSNGDASFEETMRSFNPSCAVHIYDPSLSAEQIANVPSWATFFNEPFNASTPERRYKGRRVAMLKIDCEGCEFEALPAWLEATACTDLIIPEVHGCLSQHPGESVKARMRRFHGLMSTVEREGFKVYSSEVNLLAGSPTCVEYGLMREASCASR